jgi:hypothetical protein
VKLCTTEHRAPRAGAVILRATRFLARTLAVLAILLSFPIITATPSHAACFNPPGSAGTLNYNGGSRTYEYCDGGSWVRMGGAGNTTNGLIGWWKLTDGSGTSAADSSGNGNTGTLENGPPGRQAG